MKLFNAAKKYGAKIAAPVTAVAVGLVPMLSHAVDPVDAQAALGAISTANTGYGPVMYGLAAAAVGVLIGVKWIKRGRGAA